MPVTANIGFGTGGLLRIGSDRGRRETLAAALANGIRHFDTAPIYGFGEAERALGRFLRGRRHQVTVTTKFGLRPSALAVRLAPLQRAARQALRLFPSLRGAAIRGSGALYAAPDFSVDEVRVSLESSLRAMRTDHVDFFLAHQASARALPGEDLIGVLEQLQHEGKIRAYGVATEFDWMAPVLQARPQLARVVQFDCDPGGQNARGLPGTAGLRITFGLLGRALPTLRGRLRAADAGSGAAELDRLDDDTLGGLLLRALVLANPGGIVLMQSRSVGRIERNVRAAGRHDDDARVRQILGFFAAIP
jgi:D-threo-aldose 1-dehydrogenase